MESEDYNNMTESGLCRLEKRLKYDGEGEYEEGEEGEGVREEGEEYRMKRNDETQEEFNFGNIYSTDFAVFSDKKNQSNDSDKFSDETEIQNSENSDKCGNHIMMLQCLQSPNKKDRMRKEENGRKKNGEGESENEKRGIGMRENNIDEDDTGKILTGKNSLGINSRFYGSCESKEKNTDGEIDDDSDNENDNNNDNEKEKEKENVRVFSPSRTRPSTVPLTGYTGSPVKAGTVSLSGTGGCISISACIDEIDNYYYEDNPEQKRMDMKKLKDVQHSHAYVRNSEIGKEKEIFSDEFLGRLSVGRFSVQSPPRGAGVVGLGTGYGEGMSVSDVSVRNREGGEGVEEMEEMEWKSASDFIISNNNNNNNNNGNNGNDSMSVSSSNDKNNRSKIVSASKNKNDTQHNDRDKENGNENKTEKEKNDQLEKENEWMKKKLNAKMLSLNIRKNNSLTENNENGDENDMECSTENDCLVLNNTTDNDDTNITDDNDNENDDNNENEGLDLNIDGCSFGRSVTHCFKN